MQRDGLNKRRGRIVLECENSGRERCPGTFYRGECDCFRGVSGIRWNTIFLPDDGRVAGLILNTNRNKSPREFASILPFSSSS